MKLRTSHRVALRCRLPHCDWLGTGKSLHSIGLTNPQRAHRHGDSMKIVVSTIVQAPLHEVWRAYTNSGRHQALECGISSTGIPLQPAVDLRSGRQVLVPGGSQRMVRSASTLRVSTPRVVPHQLIEYAFGDRMAVVEFVEGVEGVTVTVAFDSETNSRRRTATYGLAGNP